jgi:hypothetical protein
MLSFTPLSAMKSVYNPYPLISHTRLQNPAFISIINNKQMTKTVKMVITAAVITTFVGCSKTPSYLRPQSAQGLASVAKETEKDGAIVFKASGQIDSTVNRFRDLLGHLNSAPGATGGRREIDWDGVPAAFTNNDLFPADFFGGSDAAIPNGRKRGLIYSTPGKGFSVSDNSFSFINQTYSGQFRAFSPFKTFAAVGSNITDNVFKVPGTSTDATVHGFGVVFSDVNNASSTSMEFYDGDTLLGSFKVPNVGNNNPGGFSFLGIYFPNEKVTRVRIVSGSAPLSPAQNDISNGGGEDLVVMDDFIYSEPAR